MKALLKGRKHNNEGELQCSTNRDREEPHFKGKLNQAQTNNKHFFLETEALCPYLVQDKILVI